MRNRVAKHIRLILPQAIPLSDFYPAPPELSTINPRHRQRADYKHNIRRFNKKEQKRIWNRMNHHDKAKCTLAMRKLIAQLHLQRRQRRQNAATAVQP